MSYAVSILVSNDGETPAEAVEQFIKDINNCDLIYTVEDFVTGKKYFFDSEDGSLQEVS